MRYKTHLIWGCLAALLLIAEFVLPHYVSRLFTRLSIDLGLAAAPVATRVVVPEGSTLSNEFAFEYVQMPELVIKGTAAGVFGVPGQPGFWIAEQGETKLGPYDISGFLDRNGLDVPLESNGGVRQLVTVSNRNFALGGFVEGDCYFGALIDLDRMAMVDRFPCLPLDPGAQEFRGLGGGYAVRGNALFVAIGVPGFAVVDQIAELAQDQSSPYGKILRYDIVPAGVGVTLENRTIYTSGHRNPQGIMLLNGNLLAVEHGPKGGDEINLILEGGNYGWPLFSAGSDYDEVDITSFAAPDSGFTNPIYTFVPSIAISDLSPCPSIVANKKGGGADCLILSTLADQALYIVLGDFAAGKVLSVERIPVGLRIREVFLADDVMYLVPDYATVIRVQITAF